MNSRQISNLSLTVEEREKLLKNIINIFNTEKDINCIKSKVVSVIGRAYKCDRCYLRFFDLEKNKFMLLDKNSEYRVSDDIQSVVGKEFDNEFSLFVDNVYKKRKCLHMSDAVDYVEQNPENQYLKFLIHDLGLKSNYSCPIFDEMGLRGALVVQYINDFVCMSSKETDLLNVLANQVILIIRRFEDNQIIHQQNEKNKLISNIISTVRNTLDLSEVKSKIASEICKFFDADRCAIHQYDEELNAFLPIDKYSEYLSYSEAQSFVGVNINEPPFEYLWDPLESTCRHASLSIL